MRRMMIRYTVKEGRAAENERYVERVFAELAETAPSGLRYATFRLDDGVSFVHVVSHESPDGDDPLRALPAFQAFRAGIAERCETPPVTTVLHEVGSYRFFEAERAEA
jgi:sulfite reductase alpha subunit-like flavoprotein